MSLVFTIPECSPEDKVFSDRFYVPQNVRQQTDRKYGKNLPLKPLQTSVIIDTLHINVYNPFWGDDRFSFKPERFQSISQPTVCNCSVLHFGSQVGSINLSSTSKLTPESSNLISSPGALDHENVLGSI